MERCFTLTGIKQLLPIDHSSKVKKREVISPDEACHTSSLRSACCACSTSGRTLQGAEGQSAKMKVPEKKKVQSLDRVKSTLCHSNTFLSPRSSVLKKEGASDEGWSEAALPPPLRPPALTAFQLPSFCLL